MTSGLTLPAGRIHFWTPLQLPDLFVHFKCNSKTKLRDALLVCVIHVTALTAQGTSVPHPVLSLPSSLVFQHGFETGDGEEAGEEPPLEEEAFNPGVSCFFPVSAVTSRILCENEHLQQFLPLWLCLEENVPTLHFVKYSGLML